MSDDGREGLRLRSDAVAGDVVALGGVHLRRAVLGELAGQRRRGARSTHDDRGRLADRASGG